MRTLTAASIVSAWVLVLGCTPHQDAPEPTPPPAEQPSIIHEIEPQQAPPPIVAPKLPPLKPTRALANLELRWRYSQDDGPPPDTLWTMGTSLVAMQGDAAEALGLAGPPDELGAVSDQLWELERVGPLVLAAVNDGFTFYEAGTGGVRWQTPVIEDGRSYLYFTDERTLVAVFHGAEGDDLKAWALLDGRLLWTRSAKGRADFERIRELESDGERGYLVSERGLEAFDPITGATHWTTRMVEATCGFVVGEDRVVVEDPKGARILDAAKGTELGRVGPAAGRCAWSDYVQAGAVIADGRLYTFDATNVAQYVAPTDLRAYDLDSQAELWTASGFDSEKLVVDQDAVYLMRGAGTFVALDSATGTTAYEYGIGEWFWTRVEPVGGEAGPLVLIEDDMSGMWVFGRGEEPSVAESWEIRGRLVSDDYLEKKRLRKVKIEVNGVWVETDGKGRFVARGTGRGVVGVATPYDESTYDPDTWSRVEIESQQVELDGSGKYDLGEVQAYEGYIE